MIPKSARPGSDFTVTIDHKLPAGLGSQSFHVTLKDADGKRLERIVRKASGSGQLQVTFKLAEDLETSRVSVAAFVGDDYSTNLLHNTSGPVNVN